MNNLSFFKRRNFLFGTMSTVITVIFIVALILINFGLYQVFEIYPLKLDLTTEQTYKLSSDTIKFLKTIKTGVDIDIIDDGTNFTQNNWSYDSTMNTNINPCLQELEQYGQYNHNIKLNFIDINSDPAFAAKYPSESFSAGDLIVVSGSKYKKFNYQDFFQTQQDQDTGETEVTGNQTEQIMDSNLLSVTSSVTPIVDFTTGHNEQDATEFETLLTNNNYETDSINLSENKIASNVSAIAIIDPTVDFTSTEVEELDTFLNNNGNFGKNVMLFLDPSEPALPNIDAFAKEWGIETQPGTVYDSASTDPLNEVPAATIDYDYTGSISTNLEAYFPNSKALTLAYTTSGERTTTAIIQSSSTSALWVQKNASQQFAPSSSDAKGPFTLMAVCTDSTYNTANVLISSNVLVCGSAQSVIDSGILSTTSINNANVILGIVNDLVGVKSTISILPKTTTPASPNASATQTKVLKIILMAVIPLLVIALGIFVWLRRRHK